MTKKKFGGKLEGWYRQVIAGHDLWDKKTLNRLYGKNLGYVIHGHLGPDPTGRGFGHGPIRTSLVVKMNQEMTEIETLNTIYHLGEPRLKSV